jgi:hypothetical protein
VRKYLKTNIVVSVHPEGENPVFSDSATHVCVDDESGGAFIVLKQTGENAQMGEVRLDFEEFKVVAEVISELSKQETLKE